MASRAPIRGGNGAGQRAVPPFSLTPGRGDNPNFVGWHQNQHGSLPPIETARLTITMSDGYVNRLEIAFPRNIAASTPMMIFMPGSGGDSLTNKARASRAAGMGVIGVALAHRGAGEAGININDPATYGNTRWGHRDTIDYLELPELIQAQFGRLTGKVDLTKVGYYGNSQGGRACWLARAWGGYVPQPTDHMVTQGWRNSGQTFLTPAFVMPGNFPPYILEPVLPGFNATGVGTRFRRNYISGIYSPNPAEDTWTPENSGLGPIPNPTADADQKVYAAADNPDGFRTFVETDNRWKPDRDQYLTRALASTVPTYANAAQLEMWTETNLHVDFYNACAAGGQAVFHLNMSSGGHKSTAFTASNQAEDARLWAALKYHLLGDDSSKGAFNPASPPATWGDIPKMRIEVLPQAQSDYVDTAYAPAEVYKDTIEEVDTLPDLVLYPQPGGTLGTAAPGVADTVALNRTWFNPAYAMADFIQETLDGDVQYDEIITGGILTDTGLNFDYTIPAGTNRRLLGEVTLENLYFQTNHAEVCIAAAVFIDSGAGFVFVGSGTHTRAGVTTGVDQGPFTVPLERIGFELNAGDTIRLRLLPYWAKERPYTTGDNGGFGEVPWFTDAIQTIRLDTGATALKLVLPHEVT